MRSVHPKCRAAYRQRQSALVTLDYRIAHFVWYRKPPGLPKTAGLMAATCARGPIQAISFPHTLNAMHRSRQGGIIQRPGFPLRPVSHGRGYRRIFGCRAGAGERFPGAGRWRPAAIRFHPAACGRQWRPIAATAAG